MYTPTPSTLQPLLPLLLASIQANTALPSTLALLLTALGPRAPPSAPAPDLLLPLAHVLPALAGAHPDPELRHIAFRLLSRVLALVPSLVRLELLRDILAAGGEEGEDGVAPQMRVAAVGLLKEAVLDGLSGSGGDNAFASPLFMRTFTPLVFTTQLPDAGVGGNAGDELEAFLESPEPLRLVESLGLYYVVLQRDVANKVSDIWERLD